MSNFPHVSSDPEVMMGMPCIKGTRITVANLVRQIAAGRQPEEICRDYPDLTHESIRSALEFAAAVSASETHELAS